MSDLSIERPVSRFDQLVSGAKGVVTDIAGRVTKRDARESLTGLHDEGVYIPQNVELAVIDLQRSLLRHLRNNGIDVSIDADEQKIRAQTPKIMELILDVENNPVMKAEVEGFANQIQTFVDGSDAGNDKLLVAMQRIKCPELTNVHSLIGAIVTGAAIGAVSGAIRHIVSSPPPPPPPPKN